jgi:hypothetical protein
MTTRRVRRGALRYTDDEFAVIVMVAALDRMKPGAWAQQAAYDAAIRRRRGDLADWSAVEALVAELRQHRRLLTNIGGNLNDLVRVANSVVRSRTPSVRAECSGRAPSGTLGSAT